MLIELKLDYAGNPYLELTAKHWAFSPGIEDQTLERFIRRALKEGVVIENEADTETRTDYASIRIRGIEEA